MYCVFVRVRGRFSLPTRYVEASLEDLVHGLGIIMVVTQQFGTVAHHGPSTSIFMLTQRERVGEGEGERERQCFIFFLFIIW